MDVGGFLAELTAAFDGDLYADHPVDRRFEPIVNQVAGMSTEHTLTLLNAAVAHLGKDETYLEVGSYRGRSLAGAMLGNDSAEAVAIESFREFGADPAVAQVELAANLDAFGAGANVRLVRAEAFRFLPGQFTGNPAGVYFYDGAHSRVAQHLGLALAEPVLADRALVVVDDASWRQVDRVTRLYVARHPGYELVVDLAVTQDEDPRWCNGLKVFAWERPDGWVAPGGLEVAWRRAAHLWALDPARHLAWTFLPQHPRLMQLARRVYLHGGTSVPAQDGTTPG